MIFTAFNYLFITIWWTYEAQPTHTCMTGAAGMFRRKRKNILTKGYSELQRERELNSHQREVRNPFDPALLCLKILQLMNSFIQQSAFKSNLQHFVLYKVAMHKATQKPSVVVFAFGQQQENTTWNANWRNIEQVTRAWNWVADERVKMWHPC